MKKTQIIELLNNIKKTKVTFLSIAFFVMLGTTAYLGVGWSANGFTNSMENVLDTYNFQDVEIIYPYGLDDNYITELKKQEFIDEAEGLYSTYEYFKHNDSLIQAEVDSLTNNINKVLVIEGELPKNNKECAIENYYAKQYNIKIGDTITFIHNDDGSARKLKAIIENDLDTLKQDNHSSEDGISYLTNDTYTITALVDAPKHATKYEWNIGYSTSGTQINVIIFVHKDAFDLDVVPGYTRVLARNNSLRKYVSTSLEYFNSNEELKDKIKDFSESYIDNRNTEILNNKENIKNQIDREIKDGEKEILDAKNKVLDGEKLIKDSRIKLANSKKQLEDARIQVDEGWVEYENGLQEYDASRNSLITLQSAYETVDSILELFKNTDFIDKIDNLDSKIQNIKTIYDLTVLSAKYSLPNTYYVTELISDFFDELKNNPEFHFTVEGYIRAYVDFIDSIKNNPLFPSRDDVIAELDLAIESAAEEDKATLQGLKAALIDVYENIDTYQELPSDLLNIFDELKDTFLWDIIEKGILDKVDEELASYGIPTLKEIINKVDEYVNVIYSSYDEVKQAIKDITTYLNSFINEIDIVLENNIKSLLNDAWAKLASGKKQLDDAYDELLAAENDIANGLIEYENGIKIINSKQIEIDDARVSIADGEKKLVSAKELLNRYFDDTKDIKGYDVTILGREANTSIIGTKLAGEIIEKLKKALGLLFVVVGAFVTYTSLSRLIHDQIINLGTKKALGFSRKEVTIFFILYAAIATIVGLSFSLVLSRYIIEPIIVTIIADSMNIHDFLYYFGLNDYLVFTVFELFVTILASYLACHKILKRNAIDLLKNNEEIIGKQRFYEKSFIWNRLSLLTKTIINNAFNDSRRVFATVVGIASCTALLVSALCFKNNVDFSLSRQINDLNKYDTTIHFDCKKKIAQSEITQVLDDLNLEYTCALSKPITLKANDGRYLGGIVHSSNSNELFDYHRLFNGDIETIPNSGAIVSKAYCELNDLDVGDEISFTDSVGKKYSFTIEGFTESYSLNIEVFVNGETYERQTNSLIENNIILLRRGNNSLNDLVNILNGIDGYMFAQDYETSVNDGLRAINSITFTLFAVFLVLSIAMALLVILNLLIMFVDEKKKETLVLMINGYDKKFAKKYIYLDTIFLTILSIIIGSIFGSYIGVLTTRSLDSNFCMYLTKFIPKTYVLATLITFVLCCFAVAIALRRIDKYKLTDINVK